LEDEYDRRGRLNGEQYRMVNIWRTVFVGWDGDVDLTALAEDCGTASTQTAAGEDRDAASGWSANRFRSLLTHHPMDLGPRDREIIADVWTSTVPWLTCLELVDVFPTAVVVHEPAARDFVGNGFATLT
jgi:hypothetical protein